METFLWLAGGFCLIILIKYIYDKHLLDQNLQVHGGIKKKYKILIDELSDGETTFKEIDNGLEMSIKSESVLINYSILQGFGFLIINSVITSKYGVVEHKWEFNEKDYTQKAMAVPVLKFIEKTINQWIGEPISNTPLKTQRPSMLNKNKSGKEIGDASNLNETLKEYSENSENGSIEANLKTKIVKDLMVELLIIQPLLKLSIDKQAKVLALYSQKGHNNFYFDSYLEGGFNLFNSFKPYNEGYIYFRNQFENMTEKKLDDLKRFCHNITDMPEHNRLLAILESLSGNHEEADSYFIKSKEAYDEDVFAPKSYLWNILKTKGELLIERGLYDEAANLLENSYVALLDVDGCNYLKYEYSQTLIELSNFTQLSSNLKQLKINSSEHLAHTEDDDIDSSLSNMY